MKYMTLITRILSIILIFGVISSSDLHGETADTTESFPGSYIIRGFGSYDELFFNDNYLFDDIGERFQFDSKNDSYEAEGIDNWRTGISISGYISGKKNFAFGLSAFYVTRQAQLKANAKYLVRDPVTLDTASLVTNSTITTNFSSLFLKGFFIAFIPVGDDIRFYSSVGILGGYALDNTSAEFRSDITGILRAGESEPSATDLTFRNGTQTVRFNNNEDPVFQNAIRGTELHIGFELSFGAEWYFSDRFGISADVSGSGDFMGYFKKQGSGIISNMFITASILYAM